MWDNQIRDEIHVRIKKPDFTILFISISYFVHDHGTRVSSFDE